jgi:hypothetical protein
MNSIYTRIWKWTKLTNKGWLQQWQLKYNGWKHLINLLNEMYTKQVAELLLLVYNSSMANWNGQWFSLFFGLYLRFWVLILILIFLVLSCLKKKSIYNWYIFFDIIFWNCAGTSISLNVINDPRSWCRLWVQACSDNFYIYLTTYIKYGRMKE